MHPILFEFQIVKMDAEIGSYQEDQDPEREAPDASPESLAVEAAGPAEPGA